jgi:hypothetical protein
MSIVVDPWGILVGICIAAMGFFGWRATRRPFHEWDFVAPFLPEIKVENDAASHTGSEGERAGSAAVSTPSRPNNSLERTRER